EPGLDAYLNRMAACWTHGGSAQAVVTRMLPGIVNHHLKPLGFRCNLVEVDRPEPKPNVEPWRHGDPFWFALCEGKGPQWIQGRRRLLASLVSADMSETGISVVTRSASLATNSKAAMRHNAERFGFTMAPGGVVNNL